MKERPENFTIDYSHSLARGLVFAGLGSDAGFGFYCDSGPYENNGKFTITEKIRWVYKHGHTFLRNSSTAAENNYIPIRKIPSFTNSDFSCSALIDLNISGTGFAPMIGKNINEDNFLSVRGINSVGCYYGWNRLYFDVPSVLGLHYYCTVRKNGFLYVFMDGVKYGPLDISSYSFASNTYHNRICFGWDLPYEVKDLILFKRAISDSEVATLYNISDQSLGGLIKPPKRKLYAVRSTAYSQRFFSLQTSFGAFALQS